MPEKRGITPGYEQRCFAEAENQGQLRLVASPDGRQESLTIHQDVAIYRSSLQPGQQVAHDLKPGRHGWVQVLRGRVEVNDASLAAGDGAALQDETRLAIRGVEPAEVLVFDLN